MNRWCREFNTKRKTCGSTSNGLGLNDIDTHKSVENVHYECEVLRKNDENVFGVDCDSKFLVTVP